jgi:hypothetical protein
MKKGLTEIIFILDRSTSMYFIQSVAISGFNEFLAEQKLQSGEANFTLVLFNHEYAVVKDGINIQSVEPLTEEVYVTSGMTAYFDAVGTTIESVGHRLSNTPEEQRPEKVIFVILTDGEENSSKKYTGSKIKEMSQHQEEKYSWKFIFLAANQDAMISSGAIGISNYANFAFTPQAMGNTYSTLSKSISNYRDTGSLEQMPENIV